MTQDTLFVGLGDPSTPSPEVEYHAKRFAGRWTLDELVAALPLHQNVVNGTKVPRLECWFGQRPYAFGGRVEEPQLWPSALMNVRAAVEEATGHAYDSCFANLYRDGNDSIAWHADDAEWIGEPVVSVTFGSARRFLMRRKRHHDAVHAWALGDGDLFVMHRGVQAAWEHSIPKSAGYVAPEAVKPRLNLTFRSTVSHAG